MEQPNEPVVTNETSTMNPEIVEATPQTQNEAIEATQQPTGTEETIPETATEVLAETPAEPSQADEPTAPQAAEAETVQESETPAEEPAAEVAPTEEPNSVPAEEKAAYQEPTVDYSGMSREELTEALRELLQEEDITKIKNRVAGIKIAFVDADKAFKEEAFKQFIEGGGLKEDYQPADDPVADAYHKVYNVYRERRQKHINEVEAAKQKNLELKKAVLEELRTLIDSDNESLKETYDQFNAIQDKWKTIGEVPRTELNTLWQSYHFMVEQFFNKVRMNKELMLLDQRKNLESKTLLCEKVEELIVEPSITKAFKELQSLREQWREIGPVPAEQNEEIWTRFRTAANQIDERRRQYYEQRRGELEKNLLAKQALVEKVNELTAEKPTSMKQWNDTSASLDELLKLWKTIGPVPKEQNETIWEQFKGTIDRFYTEKKQYFDSLKDEQTENYNKKIDLCLQAEAIASREDWKKATEELLQLQNEWKNIGAVSRKVSDKVWQRFRKACDEFFARKSAYYNNLRGSEQENLEKKEAILAELKATQFGDDKEENLNILKDFQRRWMEVGFVPISEKQRLQTDFRNTINGLFEQLKISAREAEADAYRERVRNVMGDTRAMNSEREKIQEQIQHLHDEIKLLDNNMGFFASSKQADLLKEEFEKKVQKAKQEIALLQAKLRILNEGNKAEKNDAANGENKE
ncbi:MAG: DUF349 domain-containing protein [Bacteroidales bacterium]|nr:DUF349 domain-containing protein [Bacteroidales bacterium]